MKGVHSEYQELVLADETPAALERALSLARAVASGQRQNQERWFNMVNGTTPAHHPSSLHRPRSLAARRTDEVVRALTGLPSRAEEWRDKVPESQFSMLFDTLLIVFQQAYFSLLPKVGGAKRNELLKAFLAFSRALPRVADRLHVEGLVRLSMGESEAAVDLFRAAIASTSSDEHDFLTRAQMLWSVLMEADRRSDAFEFLISISSRITRNDFQEFEDLLSTTFNVATRVSS